MPDMDGVQLQTSLLHDKRKKKIARTPTYLLSPAPPPLYLHSAAKGPAPQLQMESAMPKLAYGSVRIEIVKVEIICNA